MKGGYEVLSWCDQAWIKDSKDNSLPKPQFFSIYKNGTSESSYDEGLFRRLDGIR